MKILIIGNGGREHAITWHIAQSTKVSQIFVAPGNAGTALEPKTQNIPIKATDINALVDFAKTQNIDLTIVGPEAPLAAGVVNTFKAAQLPCFGPTKEAAQLESSKAFCKAFLKQHNIPTACYEDFTDIAPAKAYVEKQGVPIVIKVDGLAAGKGVTIAHTQEEAFQAIEEELTPSSVRPNPKIVIEDFLIGEEASYIVMADGKNVLPFASSQDHKARDDGDKGPNTGGMGAYSPAPIVTPALEEKILNTVIYPTLKAMADAGHSYTGFLYAGLMINPEGDIKVLEYNCRLGDPETQPLLMRLQSALVDLCQAALTGTLDKVTAKWATDTALGVVLANQGYPGNYAKGDTILGLDTVIPAQGKVFHAGTEKQDENIIATGGRVLCCTALGKTVREAQKNAYTIVDKIHWDHKYYRRDIGHRAIEKETS